LKAIGDKAFYECENLMSIVFKSYEAPMLEETYDEYYVTYDHMPFTGNYYGYEGMGIVPFYMWNITSNFNNFFYGANFSNYVGRVEKTLVMVKPINGQNYDSFIFSQYFAATVEGSSAPMASTIKVIEIINALPVKITLEHKAIVAEARAAFDAIGSYDQKALVTNISKLTSAEAMITYLEYEAGNQTEQPPVEKPEQPEEEQKQPLPAVAVVFITIGSVLVVEAIGVFLYFFLRKKLGEKSAVETDEDVTKETDASDENQSQE
jgi:hypothetical protein